MNRTRERERQTVRMINYNFKVELDEGSERGREGGTDKVALRNRDGLISEERDQMGLTDGSKSDTKCTNCAKKQKHWK